MRVLVYDCSDRPDLGYKSPTLRVIDDDGTMVLQGIILSANGRNLAEKIAAGLGVPCEWVGPPAKPTAAAGTAVASPTPAPLPPMPLQTIDQPAAYQVAKPTGWLFSLEG
jgi:hypothetical protein